MSVFSSTSTRIGKAGRTLMYDIGVDEGHDTAYYLSLGWDVLGIEANPVSATGCRERFAKEIADGRLEVLNAGILDQPGSFTFYVNKTRSAWSSFMKQTGTTGGRYETIEVPCVPLSDIVSHYGRPYGMKVDIEGADLIAISALDKDTAPDYISIEAGLVEGNVLERLRELGYAGFKLINQVSYNDSTPVFEYEIGWRAVRKAATAPALHRAVRALPQWLRPKVDFDNVPPHEASSSGPFGELAWGPWLKYESAISKFQRIRAMYDRAGMLANFWWDVHARHGRVG